MASTAMKIVLVTGANQGIGFEIAKALSSKSGYHVLVGSRDRGRGIEAAKQLQDQGMRAEAILIDVTSDDSIAAAAKKVKSEFGRLDVLINNAGISLEDDRKPVTGAALRRLYQDEFAVNTFGAALTTDAFIPLLEKSAAPRLVFISTDISSLTNRWDNPVSLPVYRSSKSALNMIMLHYAVKFKGMDKWKINACDPGYCATNLNEFAGTNTAASGAVNAVRLATLPEAGETGMLSNKDGPISW